MIPNEDRLIELMRLYDTSEIGSSDRSEYGRQLDEATAKMKDGWKTALSVRYSDKYGKREGK